MNKNTFFRIFSLRNLFLWGNVILLLLFIAALVHDQDRGWAAYQKEFRTKEIKRTEALLSAAQTEDEKAAALRELTAAKKMKPEIRQLWVKDLNAIDRCITCHLGHDPLQNTGLTTPYEDHPYKAPANAPSTEIHKLHNLEKFGCVTCHGGQGLATEVKAAHGQVAHWEQPLLKGTLLQASCAKCHDNTADLKVGGQNYTSEIVRAKKLFKDHGCIGCHQIGGEGGPISVDLKEETAAKPLSRIDFNYAGLPHEEWTLANWIKIHLTKDPATFVPGDPKGEFNTEPIAPSGMPPYLLNDQDADAITAYILGLNRKTVPPHYLKLQPTQPEQVAAGGPIEHGRVVYEKYGCAACHGADARGGIRNYNYQYDVIPNLRRAVSTYNREELKEKISEGVAFSAKHDPYGPNPPLYMPAWKSKIKGEELESLATYLQSIRE